jgi:hypothetical protein
MMKYFGFLLVLMLAFSAHAQTTYKWETANGTVCFTDDVKAIPDMYRDAAEKFERNRLADYERYTKSAVTAYPYIWKVPTVTAATASPSAAERASVPVPVKVTQEMRWLPGIRGAPGNSYHAVDVLRDADGNEISWVLSDVGFGGIIQLDAPLEIPRR